MAQVVVLSAAGGRADAVLPSLDLLPHETSVLPLGATAQEIAPLRADLLVLDGRSDIVSARNAAQALAGAPERPPVLMVLTEGGMAAVAASWMVDDICQDSIGPAELEARIRLVRSAEQSTDSASVFTCGGVTVDESSYTARIHGKALNLTYKEFELLKFMVQNAGRVFTRAQLLHEVWGYDYYGGTRTVDVHVRRLRAKLGADHEHLITTVRNVGYSFTDAR